MERLTEHYFYPWHKEERDGYHAIGYGAIEQRPFFQIIKRLCEYEDTGLAPAEVAELAKAKADGRLVVLPCKAGDTVYLVLPKCRASRIPLAECNFFECDDCPRNKREIFEQKATTEMLSMMLFEKYNTLYVFGKTVFLTREEAEAALRKEQSDAK